MLDLGLYRQLEITCSCPSWTGWPRFSIDFGSWKISLGKGKTIASGALGFSDGSGPPWPFCDCHKESSMASTEEQGEEAGERWIRLGDESIGSPRETRPESRRSSSCSKRWNRSAAGSDDSCTTEQSEVEI